MDIVDGKIGAVGSYEVDYVEGKVVLKVKAEHGAAHINLDVTLDALDLAILGLGVAKTKIPGTIDDFVIDQAIAALKALK